VRPEALGQFKNKEPSALTKIYVILLISSWMSGDIRHEIRNGFMLLSLYLVEKFMVTVMALQALSHLLVNFKNACKILTTN
jgi:hypothetical protein